MNGGTVRGPEGVPNHALARLVAAQIMRWKQDPARSGPRSEDQREDDRDRSGEAKRMTAHGADDDSLAPSLPG
jgi:hypothetical protein